MRHHDESAPARYGRGAPISATTPILPGKKIPFKGDFRCPICLGADQDPRGRDRRCHGWLAADGWIHCARVQSRWPDRDSPTWAHPPGRNWKPPAGLAAPSERDHAREAAKAERQRAAMVKAWAESVSADAPEAAPLRAYWARRGFDGIPIPADLRFHPSLPYWDGGKLLGTWGAMLARVEGPKAPVTSGATLHRTWLTAEGDKAPVPSPRKLWAGKKPQGGAIRLGCAWDDVGHQLAVAEGIESAIAFQAATGIVTWATVSAGGLANVILPPWAVEVYIAADHDANGAGQRAAQAVAARLTAGGRTVRIVLPPEAGTDWNDVYRGAA